MGLTSFDCKDYVSEGWLEQTRRQDLFFQIHFSRIHLIVFQGVSETFETSEGNAAI